MTSADETLAGFLAESAYFHVPFCRHRCGYCNFSLVVGREYLVEDYLNALEIELGQVPGKPLLRTVYLGGGTPSHLSPREFNRLLQLIERHFTLDPDCEFTLEANPDDLPEKLHTTIADSPVTRISLGVQSFLPERLVQLDRQHTVTQIRKAIDSVHQLGRRLSLDLIFGLPADNVEIWQRETNQAVASGAGHVSIYELTIEKGTVFWNRQSRNVDVRADEDTRADIYEATIDLVVAAGLHHYEVSSFARSGEESRHNQVYWRGAPWYGFGPSATSFSGSVRHTRIRGVSRYLKQVLAGESPIEEVQRLSAAEIALEEIVFGLRRIEGVDLDKWHTRHGLLLHSLVAASVFESLAAESLIEASATRIRLTRRGLLFADLVCQRLLGEAIPAN